jgi:hypothetical protein
MLLITLYLLSIKNNTVLNIKPNSNNLLSKNLTNLSKNWKKYDFRKNTGLGKDITVYLSILNGGVYKSNDPKYHIIAQKDKNITLEHIPNDLKNNYIFIPNQELVDVEDTEQLLKPNKIKCVICKSQYAYNIFENFRKYYNCQWNLKKIIFPPLTKTLYYTYPKDRNIYFHPAGFSWMKNTYTILKAWIKNPQWPLLVVTCKGECMQDNIKKIKKDILNSKNILFKSFLEKEHMQQLQKYSGFVILPSSCEGFGHSAYESVENGNLLITSDIPPLNEFFKHMKNSLLIPSNSQVKLGDTTNKEFSWMKIKNMSKKIGLMGSSCFKISIEDVEKIIEKSLSLSNTEYNNLRLNALHDMSIMINDGINSIKNTFHDEQLNINEYL